MEHTLAETFARLLRNGAAAYGVRDVILVGGVGSNKYIRKHVEEKLAKRRVRLWVPEGRFSCDNASGCALLPGDYIKKMTEAVYSVSEINNFIKHILEQEPELRNLQVVGEISNFKRYPSGHCYFTLKDAGAVLKCVMFRSKAINLRFQPQNGDTVVAVGRLAVYERDGVYQLYTDLLLQQGVGDLMQAYEKLKQKLERAGLFAPERKQQLPLHPRTVGIITSPAGAAVRDVITVSRRRNQGIKLLLYPVKGAGRGR